MFNAITQRIRRLAAPAGENAKSPAHARDASLYLSLPSPYGGKPWLTATFAVSRMPQGYGETLRLRATMDGCMHGPAPRHNHDVLSGGTDRSQSLADRGRGVAAALARRAVEHLPSRHLEQLTARRWRSWLDIRLSSAPLDAGADALMPELLRRIYQGGLPRAGAGEPRIGVWVGPAGGPLGGIARLAVLQFDERDLGRDSDADKFNLNVSFAQLTEPVPAADGNSKAR